MVDHKSHILKIILVDDDKEDQEFFAEAITRADIPCELKIADRCTDLIDLRGTKRMLRCYFSGYKYAYYEWCRVFKSS